jgi:hypothetical protein
MKTKQCYCDYIAFTIRENLINIDKRGLIDEVGRVQYDLGIDGDKESSLTTIDVLDMQGKQYRITIQEL